MRSLGLNYSLCIVVGQPLLALSNLLLLHLHNLFLSNYVICTFYVLKSNPQPYISIVPPFVIAVLVS